MSSNSTPHFHTDKDQLTEKLLGALQDPDCPTDMWWLLAKDYPLEAIQSPLYDLLTLEDPAHWLALEQMYADRWLSLLIGKYSKTHDAPLQQLASFGIAQVLSRMREKGFHRFSLGTQLLAQRRRYLKGRLSFFQWADIGITTRGKYHLNTGFTPFGVDHAFRFFLYYFVEATCHSGVFDSLVRSAMAWGAFETMQTMDETGNAWSRQQFEAAQQQMQVWQWRRLVALLQRISS